MSAGTPVLLGTTGLVHLAFCDRTLCGVWVGSGTFGDYEVRCRRCIEAAANVCPGCGRHFQGVRGLRAHRSRPFIALDCRFNAARGDVR